MKAFVTGGTGFIGSHLVDFLISKGVETKCLVRSKEKWLENRNYTRISGDLHDLESLKKGMEGTDVLFHLAGLVMAPSQQIFDRTNVDATENIIRIAQKLGVKKIVVLSSLAAVGPSHAAPVDESYPLQPISRYGESKKRMELKIREIAEPQTSISILRPPAVYGPREEQIYLFFKIAAKGIFPMIGNGEAPRISIVHVSDVINGIWLAANHDQKGVETFFISSEETYNWNQIRLITSRALDKRLMPIRIRPGLVKNIAKYFEKISSVFGQYPVFNTEKANEMTLEWTCTVDKAIKELDYHQKIGLSEGIFETIMWYKKHHWL